MKHQSRERLVGIAGVREDMQRNALTREERLQRWADLLDQMPDRRLNTLFETEFQPISTRDSMRRESSPLEVAFEDPLLRKEGLNDDSYGEAKRFFGLSDIEMHQLVCSCHTGETVRSGTVAECVRAVAEPGPNLWSMFLNAFFIFRRS
ncbi:hypothetical protein [Ensifer adhaerens]|uniref:hypothetical protein n=1 Tax=Ensifer adhaerens TaxID=106592 RepID=UPI000CF17C7F|nr:hypothetical protein [Ensifer adhaerens]